jgi:predicted  nucleic acid-binding Zn-ribbon protein
MEDLPKPGIPAWLWPAIGAFFVALGLIGSMLVFVLKPYGDGLDRHAKEIEKLSDDMAPLKTLYAQHISDLQVIKTMQDDIQRKLDASMFDQNKEAIQRQLSEIIQQIHKLEEDIVTRPDNQTHWEGTDAKIASVVSELEALRLRVEHLSEGLPRPPVTK